MPNSTLTIMTFNIRYGSAPDGLNAWEHRREQVFNLIRRVNPPILGLQEAMRFQLDEILAACPQYDFVGVGRDDGKDQGELSPILFQRDRLRAADSGTFWLSDSPDRPGSTTWGNAIPRICTWARLRRRDTDAGFYCFNTHFDHESQPSRLNGAQLLLNRVHSRAHQESVLVVGDFNVGETDPVIARIQAGTEIPMTETFRATHPVGAKNLAPPEAASEQESGAAA